jgi:phosphatidylcholine synthase
LPLGPILVHVLTACGVVCALMATLAVADARFEAMFAWLALAFVIDGIDGPLARYVNIKERLGRFSGERLDLIVDYLTYVFVPVLAILKAELLPAPAAVPLGAAILLSALYHFSDTESKAEDNSFIGFPAIWNVVALYLFVFAPAPGLAALTCLACIALTFVPSRWIHPMRVARWRGATLLALVAWFAAAAASLAHGLGDAPAWAQIVLAAVAAYAIAVPLLAGRDASRDNLM